MKSSSQRLFAAGVLLVAALAFAASLGVLYPCARTAYKGAALLTGTLINGGTGIGVLFGHGWLGAVIGVVASCALAPLTVVAFEGADC